MNMVIIGIGAVALIAALLIVGEVTWVLRGREFSALARQIDDLHRKLSEAELRLNAQQERIYDAETSLAAANTRLEGLPRLEHELHDEQKSASDLNGEIVRLRTQARADAEAHEHLNRKLADSELRLNAQQEKINDAETSLAAANVRLEGLARLEQELHDERKSASDLNGEIVRLRTQAKADGELSALRAEIAQKLGGVADEVLKANAQDFLNLAGHSFEAQRQAMGSEIAGLLMPVSASLAKYESAVTTLENTQRERQEKWAGVATIGKELHAQLRTVGDHVNGLGTHLDRLVREFNEMIGSLEGSIMPQAQRLSELTMQGTSELLANLTPVDTLVRFPRPDRDLASRETQANQPAPNGGQGVVAAD